MKQCFLILKDKVLYGLCAVSLSRARLFATPWTVASQASLSMGFSRQEYWSGLPCPPPGDLPNPGNLRTWASHIAGRFFMIWATREAHMACVTNTCLVLEITPRSAYSCLARTLFEEHVFKTGILLLAYRSQIWGIPEINLNVHREYYGKIILY